MNEATRLKDIRVPIDVLSRINDPEKAANLAKNARLKGHNALEHAARRRVLVLKAQQLSANSPFEADFNIALLAYEAALSEKNSKNQRAGRIIQMIPEYGKLETVARVVRGGPNAIGFTLLIKLGLAEYTFENLILKYRDLFTDETVKIAQKSLSEYALFKNQ